MSKEVSARTASIFTRAAVRLVKDGQPRLAVPLLEIALNLTWGTVNESTCAENLETVRKLTGS